MKINSMAAIVTGGASGLGAAAATMLADNGAKVALFDLNAEQGGKLAKEIGGTFLSVDVTREDDVTSAIAIAERSHGVARILINCAGVAPSIKTVGREDTPHPLDAFRRAVEINLIGTFNVMTKFAARLAVTDCEEGERGVIINTASIAAYDGQIGQAAYAASKSGVVGLTLPTARDLAQHLIRVMAIAPGIFLTPMMKSLPQAAQDSLAKQVPHPRRLGRPEEFARMVESIIGNPMLNGEIIRLDGAVRMAPR